MTVRFVGVDAATVWASPDAARDVDAPALADVPDLRAWTSSLDTAARLDLHGRTLTQLLRDEPAEVLHDGPAGWVRVVAPWQPAPEHPGGYPGWVRSAHLRDRSGRSREAGDVPEALVEANREAVMECARRFLGVRYLWGGTSPWGLDCSGLVHYAYRQAGVVVPRDAHVQHSAARAVPRGQEQPGDLYFFARDDGRVFHVGFVTGGLTMLHASEVGGLIEDAPLSAERQATLVAVGRFLSDA